MHKPTGSISPSWSLSVPQALLSSNAPESSTSSCRSRHPVPDEAAQGLGMQRQRVGWSILCPPHESKGCRCSPDLSEHRGPACRWADRERHDPPGGGEPHEGPHRLLHSPHPGRARSSGPAASSAPLCCSRHALTPPCADCGSPVDGRSRSQSIVRGSWLPSMEDLLHGLCNPAP